MKDPVAVLDGYVARTYGEWSDRLDEIAPEAFAALRAVLAIHRPLEFNRAVDSASRCIYCHLGAPTRVTVSTNFVTGVSYDVHTHKPTERLCAGCHLDTGEPVEWPCPTVRSIVDALEGS